MPGISIGISLNTAEPFLRDLGVKQIPFATAKTLTDLAKMAKTTELPKRTNEQFEGGATRWTQGGFEYKRATKSLLVAEVSTRPRNQYLTLQILGGQRKPITKKILIPTNKIKKNKFGNLTKGKRQSLFTNTKKYFVGIPNGKSGDDSLGVWERIGTRNKKGGAKIRMVAKLSDGAKYSKKFDMQEVIKNMVNANFDQVFNKNFMAAMLSAK